MYSVYIDGEYEFTDNILVSAAIRYDDYEDFGDTTNYKLAANWGITDWLRLRGSYLNEHGNAEHGTDFRAILNYDIPLL